MCCMERNYVMSNDLSAVGPRLVQTPTADASAIAPKAASNTRAFAAEPAASTRLQPLPAKREVVKPEPVVKFDSEEMMSNLREAIAKLNEQAEKNGRGLNFSVDKELNRHIITVRNTSSGEVVRQIPTEVAIKVAHSLEDIKGLLLDERS